VPPAGHAGAVLVRRQHECGKVLISLFDRLGELASEHAELERALADPGVHANADQARTLAKRYAELTQIVNAYREWQQTSENEQAARELAPEDASFAKEADELAVEREALEDRLRSLLVPRDPNDDRDTILEVKAGEGGDESALFANDLLRMYMRYAERRGWKTEIIDSTPTGLGGVKDVTVAVKAGRGGTGAWSRLKYEGGVHRVQRVPVTEPRAASTPPRRACWSRPRPTRWTCTSTRTTSRWTSSGPPGPAASR
jgi:peptide chain release factor 1